MEKISSLQNDYVKYLVNLRSSKNFRYNNNSILVMGKNIVREASAICKAKAILSCEELPRDVFSAEKYFTITESILKKITGLKSPEDVVAEFPLQNIEVPEKIQRLLVLDKISDPGNLGTLMRTALAFDWDAIFLIEGSVDVFNDKTIRAAKGAHFKLPIIRGSYEDFKSVTREHNLTVMVADTQGRPVSEKINNKNIAIVLGNESHGPSLFIKSIAEAITIPMSNHTESLNVAVAGSILLYRLGKYYAG